MLALALAFAFQTATIDPCNPTPSDTLIEGQPYSIVWLMPATPAVQGFYLQWNTGAKIDVGVGNAQLTRGAPCAGLNAGMVPYTFQTKSGMPRGSHTMRVSAYRVVKNVDGTTRREEGAVTAIPFSSATPR